MTVPANVEDLGVEAIDVVPAMGPEELTQGHGVTELGAFCGCACDCSGSDVPA